MREYLNFYIDGAWVAPAQAKQLDVINPAKEQVAGVISMGSEADVDRAVMAARKAFASFSQSSRAERLDLLDAILAEAKARAQDLADAVTEEMGAPTALASAAHVPLAWRISRSPVQRWRTSTRPRAWAARDWSRSRSASSA